jgi:hypothetical protein
VRRPARRTLRVHRPLRRCRTRARPWGSAPTGETVIGHIRAHERPKVVALVGYHDDAEAGAIAVRLPYGRGDGIEEIVFGRGPAGHGRGVAG